MIHSTTHPRRFRRRSGVAVLKEALSVFANSRTSSGTTNSVDPEEQGIQTETVKGKVGKT